MGLYLWRFSAYPFQIIEHLLIVIFDGSWKAERLSRSQGERKSFEHLGPATLPRRILMSVEECLACSYTSCICIPTIYSEHSVSCRPIFQHERHLFHVVYAWRYSITAVSLGISWAAPILTEGFVVEEVVVYSRSPDFNFLECLMWKHLEKELLVYLLLTL
jgi:hypothetical protein